MPTKISQQLARINEKLGERRSQLNPTLSLADVKKFEQLNQIELPAEYREFLLSVGNGGIGPPDYGLTALGTTETELKPLRWAEPQDLSRIREVFPFTKFWIWDDGSDSDEGTQEQVSNGSLLLGTDGCAMDWHLIVTGPDRGVPWMLSGEGIQPVCPKRNFVQWFEDWLDGLDSFYGFPEEPDSE